MKICFLAHAPSIHIQRWATFFQRNGHNVQIITFKPAKIRDVTTWCIDPHSLLNRITFPFISLFLLRRIKKILAKLKPDILHAHYITNYGLFAVLSRYRPLIVSAMGSDIYIDPTKSVLYKSILRYVFNQVDAITSPSHIMANEMKYYTPKGKEISVIPFGVDIDKFKPHSNRTLTKNNMNNIAVVKNLTPIAGIEYLILALPSVRKVFPNIKLRIIGSIVKKEYMSFLVNLIKKLNLEEVVDFYGRIPHDLMPQKLSETEIFVLPSLSEALGVAILEAQALEIPVIATRVGGLPEAIRDGITGFLVKPNDHQEIADRLIELLGDVDLRNEMGMEGRKFVAEKFQWKKCAEKMHGLYECVRKKEVI